MTKVCSPRTTVRRSTQAAHSAVAQESAQSVIMISSGCRGKGGRLLMVDGHFRAVKLAKGAQQGDEPVLVLRMVRVDTRYLARRIPGAEAATIKARMSPPCSPETRRGRSRMKATRA